VQLSFEKLAAIERSIDGLGVSASCRNARVFDLGARFREALRQGDQASDLAFEELVFGLLSEATRSRANTREQRFPFWLRRVRDYLHDNFSEPITIEEIARTAGVHPTHLSRVFRQKLGYTIGSYVRRLRVDFACRELLESDRSLSDIAAAAGFTDQSHFNKIFKERFKITPYEYRGLRRGKNSGFY
jgi:AraC family transcriptional regulator